MPAIGLRFGGLPLFPAISVEAFGEIEQTLTLNDDKEKDKKKDKEEEENGEETHQCSFPAVSFRGVLLTECCTGRYDIDGVPAVSMGLSSLVLLNTASELGLTAGCAIKLLASTEDPLPTVDLPALRLTMRNYDGVSGATMMTLEIDAVHMERSENRLVGTVDVGFTLTMPQEGVDPTVRLIESAAGADQEMEVDGEGQRGGFVAAEIKGTGGDECSLQVRMVARRVCDCF